MRGMIAYLDSSRSSKTNGFIRGNDGRMYWFSFMGIVVKCGDKVEFEGEEDEKGYVAKSISAFC